MSRSINIRLLVAALVLGVCVGHGAAREIPPRDADEAALQQAKLGSTNEDLLNFLKWRSTADADLAQPEKLVKQLGSSVFAEREEASKHFIALGKAALPALQNAAKDTDSEIVKRAEACIEVIGKVNRIEFAVVRLLGKRLPEGTAGALLRFVHLAADEPLEELVWFTLDAAARKEGRLEKAFEEALKDRQATRRAAAAFLLARYGTAEQQEAAAKLLDDSDGRVRLRTAQGLLGANDKHGIPALIRLIGEEDLALAWQAEELLRWTAGKRAPKDIVGSGTPEGREKCRQAWEAWWKIQGEGLDLRKREEDWQRPGLVLLCDPGKGWEEGSVWLTGCDGVSRCGWERLRSPVEARMLPNCRVLVAEAPTLFSLEATVPDKDKPVKGRVTERDPDGKVRWVCDRFPDPVECQRLVNGNTLIVTKELGGGELTPDGRLVASIGRELFKLDEELSTWARYPRLTNEGRLLVAREYPRRGVVSVTEIDPLRGLVGGPSLRPTPPLPSFSIEEAGADAYLMSGMKSGVVLEVLTCQHPRDNRRVDQHVWEHTLPGSTHAVKLPSGHTLVAVEQRVLTFDRNGKTVGELWWGGGLHRVRSCFGLIRVGFIAPPLDASYDILIEYRLRGLKSEDPRMRRWSAKLLGEIGPKGAETIPALTTALQDPDEDVRVAARVALPQVGSEDLPKYLKNLKDQDPEVRVRAAQGLYLYDRMGRVVVPELIAALKDPDWRVRLCAAGALGVMDTEAHQVVPALVRAMEDGHSQVRTAAVTSLGELGPKANPAVPRLLQALRGKDTDLRHWAARSLGQVGPVDAAIVPALTEALKDEHAAGNAALALAAIGPKAKGSLPALIELLDNLSRKGSPSDADKLTLACVAKAVGQFGPDAKAAVPALVRIVEAGSDSTDANRNAIEALGKLGPAARNAIPVLEKLLDLDDPLPELASEALDQIVAGNR